MKQNLAYSEKLREVQIIGWIIKDEGWEALGWGCERAKSLKKLVIRNTNIAERDYLHLLCRGLAKSMSVENIDL